MSTATARIQAGFEPIPGYVLRKKLGAGGYGEVWLADAPGGLQKAIKFVFGTIDEGHASNELRSLNRIRRVNHPFILSLERVEVVNGQLIIVTELAQCSLYDRFMEFKQKGFVGITRDRLLQYLRDAADGLDFLCNEHDLQHLDVKPGNLLLVADRVKVADFGLVKDLQSHSQSMMSGLTPTYAAPEMFDGRPGRYSDQYSLAIVYQEMLTGTLPFRGRTAAQLANEHLNKAPNLEAVPLLERPILSKALSKKPHLRFGDCRELVRALSEVRAEDGEAKNAAKFKPRAQLVQVPAGTRPKRAVRQDFRPPTTSPKPADEPVQQTPAAIILPELPIVQLDAAGQNERSFFVGLGGSGCLSVQMLYNKFRELAPKMLEPGKFGWLAIDSDSASMERLCDALSKTSFPQQFALPIPLKSPQYYRQSESADIQKISRRWVYNIPRTLKTEGVRPLGMLAFLDNLGSCLDTLGHQLDNLLETATSDEPLRVYLVASAHGGTGSAIASEIGFLLRQLAAEFSLRFNIELLLLCASPSTLGNSDLPVASAISCVREVSHYFKSGGLHPPMNSIPSSVAVDEPPFDHVTLVHGGQIGEVRDWHAAMAQASEYLWAQIQTALGAGLRIARHNDQGRPELAEMGDSWLGTFGIKKLEIVTQSDGAAANRYCLHTLHSWISTFQESMNPWNGVAERDKNERVADQVEGMVSDLFRSCNWTAQAWVRSCMAAVVSGEPKSTGTHKTGGGESVAEHVEEPWVPPMMLESNPMDEEVVDIDAIIDKLALERAQGFDAFAKLLDDCRMQLVEWLLQRLRRDVNAWRFLGEILKSIANRFAVNANSLYVVAQQMGEKHDILLDSIYRGTSSPDESAERQLDTLALETRFHSVAARMLARLSAHVQHLAQIWATESNLSLAELDAWRKLLLHDTGLSINDLDVRGIERNISKDASNKAAFQFLFEKASLQLSSAWRVETATTKLLQVAVGDADVRSFVNLVKGSLEATRMAVQKHHGVAIDFEQRNQGGDTMRPTLSGTHQRELAQTSIDDRTAKGGDAAIKSDSDHNSQYDLGSQIDRTRPFFSEFGGTIRNVLVAHDEVIDLLDDVCLKQMRDKHASIIPAPIKDDPHLIAIGEQLDCTAIVDRLWMPTNELLELADRLASRVDIDWNA